MKESCKQHTKTLWTPLSKGFSSVSGPLCKFCYSKSPITDISKRRGFMV